MKAGLLTPRGWDVGSEREHGIGGRTALCRSNMLVSFLLTRTSFCCAYMAVNSPHSLLQVVLQEILESKGASLSIGGRENRAKKCCPKSSHHHLSPSIDILRPFFLTQWLCVVLLMLWIAIFLSKITLCFVVGTWNRCLCSVIATIRG